MGFKQVFDSLTVKHMDALRKQIQSLADFVLMSGTFLWKMTSFAIPYRVSQKNCSTFD